VQEKVTPSSQMLKVVLDTNIIVSANPQPGDPPAIVLRVTTNLGVQMCISLAILVEYETVLRRPKFKFTPSASRRFCSCCAM